MEKNKCFYLHKIEKLDQVVLTKSCFSYKESTVKHMIFI